MEKTNAWTTIPLSDYEQHMQHAGVGQAQLLNQLTSKYLQKHNPAYVLFLGVSGGNGLEHLNVSRVKRVCGIDINSSYLAETHKRFGAKIKQLDLINADIGSLKDPLIKADFVWAALIFEYVDVDQCLNFIQHNTSAGAKVIITLQANNGVASVSKTGIESVNAVAGIFKIVDPEILAQKAVRYGLHATSLEENYLPNGKSFLTYEFAKLPTTPAS